MRYGFALVLLLVQLAGLADDDTWQVLRGSAGEFAEVQSGARIEFPGDHAPHPQFRLEWWYITANLMDQQGRQWGLQWTLFRQALNARTDTVDWNSNQLWMAHAAVSSPQGHSFEQRFARGGIGQAGVNIDNGYEAWLDDWQWLSSSPDMFPAELTFTVGEQRLQMQLEAQNKWVLHGDQGYSRKSAMGQASYYYSQPSIKIQGIVSTPDEEVILSGIAWLDREWSSQALAPDQQGWDWFSLHLEDGSKVMVYQLRQDNGQHWLSGSWINAEGETLSLHAGDIKLVERNRRSIDIDDKTSIELPLEWSIDLPGQNRKLYIKPLYDQQWMNTRFSYWEGVVLVEDDSGASLGKGYMELTGYD
jgi:predicted secreted hydrolase